MQTRPIPAPTGRTLAALVGLAGLAALAGLAGCGTVATASPGTPTATVTVTTTAAPTTTTPASTPPAATTPMTPSTPTLGPDGYGAVRLGMTAAQARSAGARVSDNGRGAACDGLRLPGTTASTGAVDGWVSRRVGVAMIGAPDAGTKTPEGIHAGSTRAEVETAYPDAKDSPDYWSVPVAGHPGASYWWNYDKHGRVDMLALVLDSQDCAN